MLIDRVVMAYRLVTGLPSLSDPPPVGACRERGVVAGLLCDGGPERWPALVWGWLGRTWPVLMAVAGVVVVLAGVWLVVARRRRLAEAKAGRWWEIIPPSQPRAAGALEFWRLVAVVQRRAGGRWGVRRRRAVVGVELLACGGRVRIGLWLPVRVPVRAVSEAVGVAWPGARLRPGPVPQPPTVGRLVAVRGRPDPAEALPVVDPAPRRLRPDAVRAAEEDPLRAVVAGLVNAARSGQWAVVQVLARPTGRGRLRAAAGQTRPGGRPVSWWRRLVLDALDLVAPGPTNRSAGPVPAGRPAGPLAAERARAVAQKVTAVPHWEVAVTVAVAAAGRAAAEAQAAQIGGGLALLSDAATVHCSRMRHPRRAVASRRPRAAGWWLACLPELAALAHLPYSPAAAGMRTATGRQVPPPPQLYLTDDTGDTGDTDGGETSGADAA